MKRQLLITLICLCYAIMVKATEGITLGYCNGQVTRTTTITIDGESEVSAAMLLTADMLSPFVGNQISGVRAGLAARTNIDELKVWVRRSLTGENIAEGMVSTSETEIARGWNEINLDVPYTIVSNEQLYIGMTYKQRATSNALSVVPGSVQNSFFLQLNSSVEWEDRSTDGILSIEAIVTGDNLVQYDLELLSATATYNAAGGIDITAVVHNAGTKAVEGWTMTSKVGNNVETIVTDFNQTLEKGGNETINFTISPMTEYVGKREKLSLEITNLRGDAIDEVVENNSQPVIFTYQRKVLIEEFTGESCTNCPRAAKYLHEVLSQGDYVNTTIMAAHHSGYYPDWLTFRPSDIDYEWFYNHDVAFFAPAMMFDRMAYPETYNSVEYYTPCVSISSKDDIETSIANALRRPARAFLDVTAALNSDNSKIRVEVEGGRSTEFGNTPMRLTLFLVEDHIPQRHQVSLDTYPEFEHMGALRAVNTSWGDVIEWEDDLFSATYNFDIDEEWAVEDLRVIAFISEYDATDPTKCEVENANQVCLSDVLTSIKGVEDGTIVRKNIFTLDGKRVDNTDAKGIYIEQSIQKDGSVTVKKISK